VDKIERYRSIIYDTLEPLGRIRFSNSKITNETIFDRQNDRYIVATVGWESENKRIYFNLVHVDIINGKIWIQRDGTEDGVGYAFEAAGVPKSDIVPAFHPESVRPHTGYAVA